MDERVEVVGAVGRGGGERVEIKQEGNAPSFHFVGAKITS